MEKDIVPKLLELINKEFDDKTYSSDKLKKAIKLLKDKKATYKNANEFAIEIGEILAEVLGNNITAEILPDGKMYYNIADRIINSTMSKNHELISSYAVDVQTQLNHNAGLKIKGQKSKLNQSRIDGIVERLATEEDFNKIKWILDEPIINFSQNVVDDTIKVNTEFQAKAGLMPKITRREAGNCCDWCKEVVGTYTYPDVPENIYKRHRYCRCTVEYNPRDGKRQNIHTKQWKDPDKDAKIEARKRKRVGVRVKDSGPYNVETLKRLEGKNWSPEFKSKALKFYRDAHDNGIEFSDHGVARVMDRARRAGFTEKEIISICKGKPMYTQSDGKLVYSAGKGIYFLQNPKTKDFISCVECGATKPDWAIISKGGEKE